MKMMKKVAVVMLSICLLLPCFSLVSFAANDGKIMFTDHIGGDKVQTGSLVKVKGVVQKSRGDFGKIDITMTYDTAYLNYKSGDTTKVANGKLQYTGDGSSVTGERIEFFMTFEVLKAGTTNLKIQSATVKSVAGTVLDYEKGSSAIEIVGETVTPSENSDATATDKTEEIDGKTYRVAAEIPENEIPEGYEAKALDGFEGYAAIYNESKDIYLVYMIDEENVGQWFMYDKDNARFVAYEEIKISSKTSIILLADVSGVTMPKSYKKTDVTAMSGKKYPAWSSEDMPGFVILYALDSNGDKAFYRMDVEELTYQKFEVLAEEEVKEETGFIDKLNAAVKGHLDYFVYGAGLALLIFVIIIVVLSVKLFNRNAELDEIYEEYEAEEKYKKQKEAYEEEEYDDLDEYAKYDLPTETETSIFLQEGMKELFPDAESKVEAEPKAELKVEPKVEAKVEDVKIDVTPVQKAVEKQLEDTLGAVLAKQSKKETTLFDDDDDSFENFSLDFIDLDE